MVLLSAGIGGLSGALGTLISSGGSGLPTGPFIVVVGAAFFVLSLVFGKEKGILIKYIQYKLQQKSVLEGARGS
jgi:manganese/zinc/iron transport system permease protein